MSSTGGLQIPFCTLLSREIAEVRVNDMSAMVRNSNRD